MGTIRAFIAIELDVEVREKLSDLQGRLRRAPQGRLGRWVAAGGIHLTLKFLGDVSAERLPELREALRAACRDVGPFDISVAGLGCFPSAQHPRVIWVGVEEPSGALGRLQSAVERELGRLGFRPEERRFSPHLTLARVRDQATNPERAECGAWIKAQGVGRLATMRVRQVCLMRSELRPSGAVYTQLEVAPLGPSGEP